MSTPADAQVNCQLPVGAVVPTVSFGGSSWLFGGYDHTWYNHVLTPNAATPDCNGTRSMYGAGAGAMTARSYHPGGVHVSFGDGSVRFVNDHVALIVWRGISSRNGREAVATDF